MENVGGWANLVGALWPLQKTPHCALDNGRLFLDIENSHATSALWEAFRHFLKCPEGIFR